jgi:hypothetical protein
VLIAEIEQLSDQCETTTSSQNQQTPQSIPSSPKHVLVYKFSKQILLNDIRRLITLECEKLLVKLDREKVIFSLYLTQSRSFKTFTLHTANSFCLMFSLNYFKSSSLMTF